MINPVLIAMPPYRQARMQEGGSPEPPFKVNDIHSMHVVEVLVYTHLLALIHINYETEIDIDNVCKMFLQKHPRRMENSSLLFL